jgi:hypothetical protein
MWQTLSIFLFLLPCLAAAEDLGAVDQPVPSPNGLFEVYRLPEGTDKDVNGKIYGYGTKLFVRLGHSQSQGILLRENTRWMAAQWSPDSNLIGVEDHWDGHASQIYVYKVTASADRKATVQQVFHTPENAYDLQWYIEGWGPSKNLLHLRRDQRTNDGIEAPASWKGHASIEHVTFKIKS